MRHIWKDVAKHDTRVGIAERFRRKNICAKSMLHYFCTNGPADADPSRKADSKINSEEPLADYEGNREDKEEARHRSDSCGNPDYYRIDFTAEIAA